MPTKEATMPKIDKHFIVNIKGKDFVVYAGVLVMAKSLGLISLKTEILQFPSKENGYEAITKSVAETKNGEKYEDVGDASPRSCDERIAKHLIRVSSTRSKSRVLSTTAKFFSRHSSKNFIQCFQQGVRKRSQA